jgi:hypothetical protein
VALDVFDLSAVVAMPSPLIWVEQARKPAVPISGSGTTSVP